MDARAPTRDIRVGDRVRLRTLGSTGIVDRIRGNQAELRVGSLHMREKLANLELVEGTSDPRDEISTSRASGRVKTSLEELQRVFKPA